MSNTYTSTDGNVIHRSAQVDKPRKIVKTKCYRCGGQGGSTSWPGFTCFRCGGSGVDPRYFDWAVPASWTDDEIKIWDDKRVARNLKAKNRAADRKAAKREAAQNEFLDTLDDAIRTQLLAAFDNTENTIITDIRHKFRQYGGLSDKQVDFVLQLAEEDREAAIAAANAPVVPQVEEGKRTITGTIVGLKWKTSQFGYNPVDVLKMTVALDDGTRVWGTVPTSIFSEAEIGTRVTFTATVKRGDRDETFGFFKRPTKASVAEAIV